MTSPREEPSMAGGRGRLDGMPENPSWEVTIPDFDALTLQAQHEWWLTFHEAIASFKSKFTMNQVEPAQRRPALPDGRVTRPVGSAVGMVIAA